MYCTSNLPILFSLLCCLGGGDVITGLATALTGLSGLDFLTGGGEGEGEAEGEGEVLDGGARFFRPLGGGDGEGGGGGRMRERGEGEGEAEGEEEGDRFLRFPNKAFFSVFRLAGVDL